MKNIGVVTALLLAATLSSGVMAAEKSQTHPEAGSNIDTSMHQNHIDVSHAFDKESLTAGWIGPYISIHFLSLNP